MRNAAFLGKSVSGQRNMRAGAHLHHQYGKSWLFNLIRVADGIEKHDKIFKSGHSVFLQIGAGSLYS
jgi:hypothetical protein